MSPETVPKAEELPAPSAEMVLIRVAIESYLATAHMKPRERSRAFFDKASSILADEESVALLFPIRPASGHSSVSRARREAVAIWQAFAPTFLARIPRE